VLKYHKHSHRASSGGWTFAVNFLDAGPRMVSRSGNPFPSVLGRLELDDKGTVVKLEDAKGNPVTLPAKGAEVLADLKAKAMKNDERSSLHFPQSATGTANPNSVSQLSRGPALVNSRLHDQLISSLAAYFGTPSRADGRARYLRQTGSSLTEVIVDEASGAISEENEMIDRKLIKHVTHQYQQVGDGVLLDVLTRVERSVPGMSQPVSTEIRLSNVRLSLSGGEK
jgi:hypothetical protein